MAIRERNSERTGRWVAEAQAGSEPAMEHLIEENMGLVRKVAQPFIWMGFSPEDAWQWGRIGFIQAVRHFDPGRGTKLSTFATTGIQRVIQRAWNNEQALIRLPVHARRCQRDAAAAAATLEAELGREPDTAEIAGRLGIAPKSAELYLRPPAVTLSLDYCTADDEGRASDPFAGCLAAAEAAARPSLSADLLDRLQEAMESLPVELREVLIVRFGLADDEPRTLKLTSEALGISDEGVRARQVKAIAALRHFLGAEAPHDAIPGDLADAAPLCAREAEARPRGRQSAGSAASGKERPPCTESISTSEETLAPFKGGASTLPESACLAVPSARKADSRRKRSG